MLNADISKEVLNYRLMDSASGLWRRLWSLGYDVPHPRKKEQAHCWVDRRSELMEIIREIKAGRLNNVDTDTLH